jgi:hypothetical protein
LAKQAHYHLSHTSSPGKSILKFILKNKGPQVAKVILSKKSNVAYITILEFKLQYRAFTTKLVWFWHKNRHKGQWSRIDDPEIKLHSYSHFIFDLGVENIQWTWGYTQKTVTQVTPEAPAHPCLL